MSGLITFKVNGLDDKIGTPWPPHFKIPGQALIGFGVPPDDERPFILAFGSKDLHSHASLEPVAAPLGSGYRFLPAELIHKNGQRFLQIPVFPKGRLDTEREKEMIDPRISLHEGILKTITDRLGVKNYEFAEITVESEAIRQAQEKEAQEIPKGGLSHRVWEQEHRLE